MQSCRWSMNLFLHRSEHSRALTAIAGSVSHEFIQRNGDLWKFVQDLAICRHQLNPFRKRQRDELAVVSRASGVRDQVQNATRRDRKLVVNEVPLCFVSDVIRYGKCDEVLSDR